MQTFLPFRDFTACASVLDRQRLGKQRVEVVQILRTLDGEGRGWRNHPVVQAWAPYTDALRRYGVAVCEEWVRRGYRDTCLAKIAPFALAGGVEPRWLTEELCSQYRGVLLRKNPEHYGGFGWGDAPRDAVDYKLFDKEES